MVSASGGPFRDENKETWKQFYSNIPYLDSELSRWGLGTALINFKDFFAYRQNQANLASGTTTIDLYRELSRFATLTGTIGNFTTTDIQKNMKRARQDRDYWDLTLCSWRKAYKKKDDLKKWKTFIRQYDLQGYIYRDWDPDRDYSVGTLWKNHTPGTDRYYPRSITDFEQFYLRSNQLITARGKLMTKQLIENLDIIGLPLYKEYGLDKLSVDHYYNNIISD